MIKMSKEELVGKLNLIYVGNKDALDEMIGYYDGLKMVIEQLKEDNEKQKTIIQQVVKEIERFSYCNELEIKLKKQKEINKKAIEYIKENLIISSTLDGKKYYCLNEYGFDYKELLQILKDKREV